MNTEQDQKDTTAVGGNVATETVETPTQTTETPADETAQAKPVETAKPEAETPKAATEAPKPKDIGKDPIYQASRRAESKAEEALKANKETQRLVRMMLKNSGTLSEEDTASLEADEKKDAAASAATARTSYTQIALMAGRARTNLDDPRLAESAKLHQVGDYAGAVEAAKIALKIEEKPMEPAEEMVPKSHIDQEVARQVKEALAKQRGPIDLGLPSGGGGINTDKMTPEEKIHYGLTHPKK